MFPTIKKRISFISLLLVFVLLLTSCNSSTVEPENRPDPTIRIPTDQAPSADLYLWYSANEKVEHTFTCEPVFGDGCYFTPDVVIVKYFSLKNLSEQSRSYNLHFEVFQPNEEEREKPFLTEVLKHQIQWDTKFGSFEWREDIAGDELYFVNGEPYETHSMICVKEVAAGEEVFFAIAIRMDSDAPIEYLNKKMFIDIGVSDLSREYYGER